MKVNWLIILYVLVINSVILPQGKNYGLHFTGNNLGREKETEVNLTGDSPVPIKNSLSISFDFSIWDDHSCGLIFRSFSENKFSMDLVFVPYKNMDTSFVELVINHKPTPIKLPIAKRDIYRGKWYTLKLYMDLLGGKVSAALGNSKAAECRMPLPGEFSLFVNIGPHNFDLDVPNMALRDFQIKGNNKLLRYWKFDEASGNTVYDCINNNYGSVRKGQWLLARHFNWEKVAEISSDKYEFACAAFDSARHRILIPGRKNLYLYETLTGQMKNIRFSNERMTTANLSIYNPVTDKLLGYYRGQGQVSEWNGKTGEWSVIDTSGDNETNYYLHANFIDPRNGGLYMLGGYGWYKFSNDLQKYDFNGKKWNRIKTSGDYLYPRRNLTLGMTDDKDKVYVFGGVGNKSGEQDAGFGELNDVFELDLRTFLFKKLFTLPNEKLNSILLSQMIYDKESGSFIGIAVSRDIFDKEKIASKKIILFRLDIKNPGLTVLNTYNDNELNNVPLNLFLDEVTKELFLVTSDNIEFRDASKITIYRLSFPPLSRNVVIASAGRERPVSRLPFYSALAVISAASLLYLKLRKNRKAPKQSAKEASAGDVILSRNIAHEKYYKIKIFGDFAVSDKEGNEITVHFKPKLRQLFLLILLNTYSDSYKFRGITSEKLTSCLWPDSDIIQAKNNRNVSIARLRGILSEAAVDAEVVYEDSLWSIRCGNEKLCDYFDYLKMKSGLLKNPVLSISEADSFMNLLGRGIILKDVSYEWLDPLKASMEQEVTAIASNLLKAFSLDNEMLLKISDVLLLWDPVNEEALSAKLKVLLNSGRTNDAKAAFEKYSDGCREITGSPCTKNINEFLSGK